MTAVRVPVPDALYARLRYKAFRRRSTVPTLLAELAERAAAALPEPSAPPHRPLTVVLRERVAALLDAGQSAEEIAVQLGVRLERIQRTVQELGR